MKAGTLLFLLLSQTGDNMMTIEVITKPTLWDYVEKYFYIPALFLLVAFIIYRKVKAR